MGTVITSFILSLLKTSRLRLNHNTADYLIRHFGGAFLAQAKRWRHAGQHLVHISVMNTATGRGQSPGAIMMKKSRRRRRKNWAFPRNEGGEEDWRGGKKETTEKIEEETGKGRSF